MNRIIEILDEINEASKEYEAELKNHKEDFENEPFTESKTGSNEEILKHQKHAYNLFQMYLGSQLQAIENFKSHWNDEEQINYLKNYDSHTLTNGKFYDYAVGHYAWRPKREDLYQMIESKINLFLDLRHRLKEAFREYILSHYDKYLRLISPEIAKIIETEHELGNKVVSTYHGDYTKHKMFLQLNSDFNQDYMKHFPNLEYRHVNNIHYWNKEYQDYYTILVSGFETNKTTKASG